VGSFYLIFNLTFGGTITTTEIQNMDGFSDSFGANNSNSSGGPPDNEADPAAEFLAREQEELAGLEDDITTTSTTTPNTSMVNNNNNDDAAESPHVVTNGISSDMDLRRSPSPTFNSQPSTRVAREEPEKIRRWREEQQKRLQKKDEDEEKKKGEMREAARKELDEWYKNHDEQVVKTRQSNRSAEKELVADTEPMAPGTEWERIAKLCDFNPKASKHTKDISRMRSIILQVKQGPPPGKIAGVEKK